MKATHICIYIPYNRDLYVHIREVGICLFTQWEKRHGMSLKQDSQWGSFRYKVFQQELSAAFGTMCSVQTGVRQELFVTLAYATYNQQQELNTCVKYFFPWFLSSVFSFWFFSIGPFWIYFSPYYVPYFPTASVMTFLSSQELAFLGFQNN